MSVAMTVTIEPERIICPGTLPGGRDCRQLLAKRYASGAVVVVVKGNEQFLNDGRVQIDCPSCGRRIKVKAKRSAA